MIIVIVITILIIVTIIMIYSNENYRYPTLTPISVSRISITQQPKRTCEPPWLHMSTRRSKMPRMQWKIHETPIFVDGKTMLHPFKTSIYRGLPIATFEYRSLLVFVLMIQTLSVVGHGSRRNLNVHSNLKVMNVTHISLV